MNKKAEIKVAGQTTAVFDVTGFNFSLNSGLKAVSIASGIFIVGDTIIQLNTNICGMYIENSDKQLSNYKKYFSCQLSLQGKKRNRNKKEDKKLVYDRYNGLNEKKQNCKKDKLYSGKKAGLAVEYYLPEEAFICGWADVPVKLSNNNKSLKTYPAGKVL